MGESLGAYCGSEMGYSNGMSVGEVSRKLEGYLLIYSLGADGGAEIGSSNGSSDGNGYFKLEGSPL